MKPIKAIFIVAGHSKYNPWATYNWYKERDFVKKITQNLYNRIPKDIEANIYIIWMEDISLWDKVTKINNICKQKWYNVEDSIMIEIHTNAWGWTWIEALWYVNYEPFQNISNILLEETVKTSWMRNRGLKPWNGFYMIDKPIPLSIIFECGFIDKEEDLKLLRNEINVFSDWLYNWLKRFVWFKETETESKYKKIREKIISETWFKELFDDHEWKDKLSEAEIKDLIEIAFARNYKRLSWN